jgi:hypothetical protein
MKTPYLIKNAAGHYWLPLDGCFIEYPEGDVDAAQDGMGISPVDVEAELMRAKGVDVVATLTCADNGPCLATGFTYFDGRYNQQATVLHATEDCIWAKLEKGTVEEISKRFYDYHMQAGIYYIPRP